MLAAGMVLSASSSASADPQTAIDLSWSAPLECPTRDQILAEVGELTGERMPTQKWRVEATVERRSAQRWVLRLTTKIDDDENSNVRNLAAPSCSEIAHAAAVMLAIDVDPKAAAVASEDTDQALNADDSRSAENSNAPQPRPIRMVLPAPSTGLGTADAPPTSGFFHHAEVEQNSFAASALGGGSVGISTTPAFGMGLALAWLHSQSRLEIGGQWFPSSHVDGSLQDGGGEFDLLLGEVTGCWSVVPGRIANLATCAGAQVGRLRATGAGSGLEQSTSSDSLWLAPKAGGLFTMNASRTLALRLADFIAPLERSSFVVAGEGSIHTPSLVAFETLAGVEMRFR